jgi:hypothetical protein
MNISEQLTQEQFLEAILRAYQLGRENENMQAKEFVEVIKQQLLHATALSDDGLARVYAHET